MKINFFKLKRNKRYNYTRYYKGKEEEGSYRYSLDSRFIKYRKVFNKNDFGQKWSDEEKNESFSNRFHLDWH